jgi:electron transfer flavoprotein alpha/beta subunit
MPMTPAAAKKYKPRRTPESQNEVIYPETRAKMEAAKAEVADRKAAADNEAAYDLSSRVSMGDMFEKKAKGGSVGSASSRADGCCTKGKTRGKMV